MSEWRLIDTAPKDGSYILGYDANKPPEWRTDGEENPHIIQWDGGRWRIQLDGQTARPTHWMSLPDPPR